MENKRALPPTEALVVEHQPSPTLLKTLTALSSGPSSPPPSVNLFTGKSYKILSVDLPIHKESDLGKEIDQHMNSDGNSVFKEFGNILENPHVNLLEILIPKHGPIDTILSIPVNFYNLIVAIKDSFNESFNDVNLLQLELSNYESVNGWITRKYNASKAPKYSDFLKAVIEKIIINATESDIEIGSKNYRQYIKDDSGVAVQSQWDPRLSIVKAEQHVKPFNVYDIYLWRKDERRNTGSTNKEGDLSCVFATYKDFCCYQDL